MARIITMINQIIQNLLSKASEYQYDNTYINIIISFLFLVITYNIFSFVWKNIFYIVALGIIMYICSAFLDYEFISTISEQIKTMPPDKYMEHLFSLFWLFGLCIAGISIIYINIPYSSVAKLHIANKYGHVSDEQALEIMTIEIINKDKEINRMQSRLLQKKQN